MKGTREKDIWPQPAVIVYNNVIPGSPAWTDTMKMSKKTKSSSKNYLYSV